MYPVCEVDIERLTEGLVNIFAIRNPTHQLFHEIHLDLLNLQKLLPLVLE